jgi:hypothetical protein
MRKVCLATASERHTKPIENASITDERDRGERFSATAT